MAKTNSDRWAKRLGVALGLICVASAAVVARVQGGGEALGADVTFASSPTGELSTSPIGPFVQGLNLEPGRARQPAVGSVKLHNQTGSDLALRVRAVPSISDLDDVLEVRISAIGQDLFVGTLGRIRDWSSESVQIPSGETTALSVNAWIPSTATDGYQGRIADIAIEFRTVPVS